MDIDSQKAMIRRGMMAQLKAQSPEAYQARSLSVERQLAQDFIFANSRMTLFYVSIHDEVDTRKLLRDVLALGRRIAVPYIDRSASRIIPVEVKDPDKELVPGSYGILEPATPKLEWDLNSLDCVLVPGVAFDLKGNRLGRGKGYYDRFLATLPSRVRRYGLAFDFQILDSIPTVASDMKVDKVFVSESWK